MTDPFTRASFQISTSLLRFMISEGVMTNEQVIRFMDGMIEATKKAPQPDTEVLPVLQFVRDTVAKTKEPTRN